MRVFVTGHLGYIGTILTPMLLQAGHEVVGCDADLYESCTFAPGGAIMPVRTLKKDIRDLDTADLLGFDAVLHLGDYIYEFENGIYGDGTGLLRIPEPRKAGLARVRSSP